VKCLVLLLGTADLMWIVPTLTFRALAKALSNCAASSRSRLIVNHLCKVHLRSSGGQRLTATNLPRPRKSSGFIDERTSKP
jgi:hypothetical protein